MDEQPSGDVEHDPALTCVGCQCGDANPRQRRCSLQSSGSRVSSMRWRAVNSGGCLPRSIALTMSGAKTVRRYVRI
jgi:hypothetical protein